MENLFDSRQYFNHAQLRSIVLGCHDSTIVAGRGFGKATLQAAFILQNMQLMPGSFGGIVAANCKRALTNTLPPVFEMWERWGYRRDVHFVVGHRPPKRLGFVQPRSYIGNYENVISFYNGSVAFIISQDRAGTSNSFSLDWVSVDEAKFVDYAQYHNETEPANRGNTQLFGRCSRHHSVLITSDMPTSTKGSWFLKNREKMQPELIAMIEGLLVERWRIMERVKACRSAGAPFPDYLRKYLRNINIYLEKYRAVAYYYKEYSSIENLQILGESFIRRMKRDLPPLTFQTSVLCKRPGIQTSNFYNAMREAHKYNSTRFEVLDGADYDFKKIASLKCLADADLDLDAPICTGWDYNANINWLVAAQPKVRELKILKSFYVTFERKLPELVDDFCDYYQAHRNKTVIVYYDTTALAGNYAVNSEDFITAIERRFQDNGWFVIKVFIGNPMKHSEKQFLINEMFAGRQRLVPMINEQNNEDLIICIEQTGVYNGKKDKRGEKDDFLSEENPIEHRTDGSDAFDQVCIGCERFPQSDLTAAIGMVDSIG